MDLPTAWIGLIYSKKSVPSILKVIKTDRAICTTLASVWPEEMEDSPHSNH